MSRIHELRKKRARLIEQARSILDTAQGANRDITGEEQRQWDRLMNEADAIGHEIDREERLTGLEASLNARTQLQTVEGGALGLGRDYSVRASRDNPEYRGAFNNWLRRGHGALDSHELRTLERGLVHLDSESRALAVGTGTAGGYTVPEDFYRQVIAAMQAFGGMREAGCTILRTDDGVNLPIPTSNDTANEGAIVPENTEVDEEDVAFGQVVLRSHMYTSKIVRVSFQLMQDSAVDLGAFLADTLATRVGRVTNRHFTTGTGTGEPKGVLTAATLGKTAAAVAAVTYDELVDLLHSVDPAYRRNGRWMFNDATLAFLRKLKDGDDNPIWQPGLVAGRPDTLLGRPYVINPDMPDLGAGAKPILFGDFSKYFIRDVTGGVLLRMQEAYAKYLQVGFLWYSRHDGQLVDAGTHPVKYLQNAAE